MEAVQRFRSCCGQLYLVTFVVSAVLCCYAAVHIKNVDDTVMPYAFFKQIFIFYEELPHFHQSVAVVEHEDLEPYVCADCAVR